MAETGTDWGEMPSSCKPCMRSQGCSYLQQHGFSTGLPRLHSLPQLHGSFTLLEHVGQRQAEIVMRFQAVASPAYHSCETLLQ